MKVYLKCLRPRLLSDVWLLSVSKQTSNRELREWGFIFGTNFPFPWGTRICLWNLFDLPQTASMFWLQVRWDNILMVNHRIQGIVCFGSQNSVTILSLKGVSKGWRRKEYIKLPLTSTPKRYETIGRTKTSSPIRG